MKRELEALTEELRRLRREGVQNVYLAEDMVSRLAEVAVSSGGSEVRGGEASPSAAPTEEVSAAMRPARSMEAASPVPDSGASAPAPKKKVAAKPAGFQIAPIPESPVVELPEGSKQERWDWLRDQVLNCPVCREHARLKEGKHIVFGVGSVDADIFFCGEAPGADEESQGEPFVGRAGQLLTKIIETMGLAREQVYIGNILNWRPEKENMNVGNRAPTPEEMRFCLPYLKAQIEVVQPKVIVALGKTALSGLLDKPTTSFSIGKMRGQWHEFQRTPLMPTYHPSYVLRYGSPKTKREIWEDMLMVMEKVGMEVSERQRRFFLPKS